MDGQDKRRTRKSASLKLRSHFRIVFAVLLVAGVAYFISNSDYTGKAPQSTGSDELATKTADVEDSKDSTFVEPSDATQEKDKEDDEKEDQPETNTDSDAASSSSGDKKEDAAGDDDEDKEEEANDSTDSSKVETKPSAEESDETEQESTSEASKQDDASANSATDNKENGDQGEEGETEGTGAKKASEEDKEESEPASEKGEATVVNEQTEVKSTVEEKTSEDEDTTENSRSKLDVAGVKDDTAETETKAEETPQETVKQSSETVPLESVTSEQKTATADECSGRYIFMYNLPAKFNKALIDECESLIPWLNMCPYFQNDGLGQRVQDSDTLVPIGRWYETHQYALELLFHNRMKRSYPCLTSDPDEAELFYVPYYAALDVVRWHNRKDSTIELKDQLSLDLVEWLEKKPQFSRRDGQDHFLVIGKSTWDFRRKQGSDWGNRLLELPSLNKVVKLLLERDVWRSTDVGVPHPTSFHPRSDRDLFKWQKSIYNQKRESKVSFVGLGGIKASLREVLVNQCQEKSQLCRFMECVEGVCSKPEAIVNLYLQSDFCLIPPGDANTKRAVFDSLISGCIPVVFDMMNDNKQLYQWHLPKEYSNFSVYIDENEVRDNKRNVVEELGKFSLSTVRAMRKLIVWHLLPQLIYKDPRASQTKFKDAFDLSIENLLEVAKVVKEKEALNRPRR